MFTLRWDRVTDSYRGPELPIGARCRDRRSVPSWDAARSGRRDTPLTIATLRVKDKVRDTKETVQAKFEQISQNLHKDAETLQDQADDATLQAKRLANKALAKVRPPVAGRMRKLSGTVRNRPAPAAAVVMFGLLFVLRRLLRRNT